MTLNNNNHRCDCDFDSQSCSIFDIEKQKIIKKLTIMDYMYDKNLRKQKDKKEIKLLCEKENELTI